MRILSAFDVDGGVATDLGEDGSDARACDETANDCRVTCGDLDGDGHWVEGRVVRLQKSFRVLIDYAQSLCRNPGRRKRPSR